MVQADKVIKALRLTEKTNLQSAEIGQYTFEVFPNATKGAIKSAIEKIFEVKVTRVNVLTIKGKPTKNRKTGKASTKSSTKKAVVTLKQGDTIEIV